MQTRVQMFGDFRLIRDGHAVPLRLLSTKKLLAYLAWRPGQAHHRTDIAEVLWPDVDYAVSGNRLRTSLVELRSALDPAVPIAATRTTIELQMAGIDSDLRQAKQCLRRLRLLDDPDEEERAWTELRALTAPMFLPGWNDSWIQPERIEWRAQHTEALVKLAGYAENRGELEVALELLNQAQRDAPYDERAWSGLLRVESRTGRQIAVIERFSSAVEQIHSEQKGTFSQELMALARSVRGGTLVPIQPIKPAAPGVSQVLQATFARMLAKAPNEALAVLSTPSFRAEMLRAPQDTVAMLDEVMEATEGVSPERLATANNCMGAHAVLNHVEPVLRWGMWLLEHDTNDVRRRSAALNVCFTHFHIRNWDAAEEFAHTAIKLSSDSQSEIGVQTGYAQLASFAWHQGRYEEAIEGYLRVLRQFERLQDPLAKSNIVIIFANLGIVHTITEEFTAADKWFHKARHLAEELEFYAVHRMGNPIHGFVKASLGDLELAKEWTSAGITMAFRDKDARALEIGLEYAAGTLSYLGWQSEAMAALEVVNRRRIQRLHTRSVAEEKQVARIQELAGHAAPNGEWLKFTSNRELVRAITEIMATE